MILKTLLTLAVILAVYIWIRTQQAKRAGYQERIINSDLPAKDKNSWLKSVLFFLAGIIIIAAVAAYYFSWVDGNTQYQVTITNPQSGIIETFVVLKKDMRGRLFITPSGREIWASDLDRIEIKKMQPVDY